ncbi:hypothetical protein Pla175_34080 [Pirellulimonas nuda]|uniref:Amine oxidase domain-containing protein n=1 Tax=Pirellulimonas nuda TaxID=2528009 RepID=A0A518DEW2_9BACT|nr:NAD(P)/FAD-dependent oxidoreductase [Pirellulimonas nuda]QDU90009.1 hypothetical protein Pla175_34080 [Pirellulimonas nuda]
MKIINATPSSDRGWAVVGGGALGLTMALRLAQRGVPVTVLEAAPQLGGLASPWRLSDGAPEGADDAASGGDATWDRFYHVTLLSDSHLRGLLGELGLEEKMRWVETKTGFYSGGKLHSMSNSLEFLRFPPLTTAEKLRLGATIFYASKIKNWRKMEQVPVADWLLRHSGRGVCEKIWLPLLRAKLGDAYRDTSAAFIWAHINRMYSARRSGLKKEMFGYVPGGYATVLGKLYSRLRELGVEIRCGSTVWEARSAAGDAGVEVTLQCGETRTYSNVVFTTPSPTIAAACPQLTPAERDRFEGVRYLGVVCASLLLKRPISPYYVTNITDGWVPLTGVIEMTTIVDPAELGGRSLVYLPKYASSDDAIFKVSDAELRERWLGTLEKMYPHFRRDQVEAFRVARARQVMALPTVGYSDRLPPMKTSVPGVWGVNSAHILKGNLNVNETIQVAEQAIRGPMAMAVAASRPYSSFLPPSYVPREREFVARS